MIIETNYPRVFVDVGALPFCGNAHVSVTRLHVHVGCYCLDKNHAAALALAIQAAVAELQARAVSR